jgi:thiamine-phosphate pyrophosphorylase
MASPQLTRLWRTARALQSAEARRRGLPPLWFMTDRRRVADPLAAAAVLPPGAGVILRDYDMAGRGDLALALAALSRRRRLVMLVAGDERLATLVGADGVHLPEGLVREGAAIKRRHPGWIVTAAAHSLPALRRAQGLDGIFLSPVFTTKSHPGAPTLGPVRFAALVRRAGPPVYALGGVDSETARRLRDAGAAGIAAIGGITG